MPKFLSDSRVALMLLDEAPADPDAMTVTEWDAGTALECRVEDLRVSPVASDTVSGGEFCNAINAQIPTRSNYEGNLVVLRYFDEDGIPDPSNDVAFDAVREKGTTLHLAIRKGPKHDAAGEAGQEYSYFEVVNDWPTDPTDWGGWLRSEVTLYPQRASLNKVLVAP